MDWVAIISLVIRLGIAFLSRAIAMAHGYSGHFFWLGLFYPLPGIIVPMLLPYLDELPEKIKVVPEPTPVLWTCSNCNTEHIQEGQYCVQCGEKRQPDWMCGACDAFNPAGTLFCLKCGSENPNKISADQQGDGSSTREKLEQLLAYAENAKYARDVYVMASRLFTRDEGPIVFDLLKSMQASVQLERMHGSTKRDTLIKIRDALNKLDVAEDPSSTV